MAKADNITEINKHIFNTKTLFKKNPKAKTLEASLKVLFQPEFLQGQQNNCYRCVLKEEPWCLTWITVTLTSEMCSLN